MKYYSFYDLEQKYLDAEKNHEEIIIDCWVRNNRVSGKIGFLDVTDGTARNIQIVYKKDIINNFDKIAKLNVWTAVEVTGFIVLKNDTKYEIEASKIEVLAESANDFPLQNKEHSFEFLREISHLRPRSNFFNAVMRIRSEAAYAIHNFYHERRFLFLTAPEITENDGEGAGENFLVKSRDQKNEFFGSEAYLSVSGQLHAEAYAAAFKDVYTFGPTFRAENSHTNRHISEFWMVEPEMSFSGQRHGMEVAEANIKYVIKWILDHCRYELEICEKKSNKPLIKKLEKYLNNDFPVVEYRDAIEILKKSQESGKANFENKDIFFGLDLGSEHEKFLCEQVFDMPIFLINYPKDIKAFYMKLNSDNETVAAYDCLVPGIGEVVGGSERENDVEKLKVRCKQLSINPEKLEWYIDLRKYGYYKSVGFGLGFERLIMMLTNVENIRDVIPFPRFPGQLKF